MAEEMTRTALIQKIAEEIKTHVDCDSYVFETDHTRSGVGHYLNSPSWRRLTRGTDDFEVASIVGELERYLRSIGLTQVVLICASTDLLTYHVNRSGAQIN